MTGNEEAMALLTAGKQYSELHSIKYFNPAGIAVFVMVENDSRLCPLPFLGIVGTLFVEQRLGS
jgi:hypothetical protein